MLVQQCVIVMRSLTTAPEARDTSCAKVLERRFVSVAIAGDQQQWLEVINGKLGESSMN